MEVSSAFSVLQGFNMQTPLFEGPGEILKPRMTSV